MNNILGPLMDRIDLHVEVTPVSIEEISSYEKPKESSKDIAERVVKARTLQRLRRHLCECSDAEPDGSRGVYFKSALSYFIKKAMECLQLSARAYDRILKVARTAADLAASSEIKIEHLVEAIQYRSLDRENWAE